MTASSRINTCVYGPSSPHHPSFAKQSKVDHKIFRLFERRRKAECLGRGTVDRVPYDERHHQCATVGLTVVRGCRTRSLESPSYVGEGLLFVKLTCSGIRPRWMRPRLRRCGMPQTCMGIRTALTCNDSTRNTALLGVSGTSKGRDAGSRGAALCRMITRRICGRRADGRYGRP